MKTFYLKIYADDEQEARKVIEQDNLKIEELKDNEILKTMTDDLQATVEQAQEELKDRVKDYLLENLQCQDDEEVYQNLDLFHEIADSNTPIYNSDIYDTYHLNRHELLEAYENAGVGELQKEDNPEQACIYFYIFQELHNYFNNELKDAINEFCEYRDGLFENDEKKSDKELKDYIEKSLA